MAFRRSPERRFLLTNWPGRPLYKALARPNRSAERPATRCDLTDPARSPHMSRLSLDQANSIIAAALAKGRALGLKPLGVAVLDAGGHLIAFQRQDGAATL